MSSYRSIHENKWGEPPLGYVPGYGRGAVGFTTRSDIGNAANITDSILNPFNKQQNNSNNNVSNQQINNPNIMNIFNSINNKPAILNMPNISNNSKLFSSISKKKGEEDDDQINDNMNELAEDNNFDKWDGNDQGLFSSKNDNILDEEDKEAEIVYNQVDTYLEDKQTSTKEKEVKKKLENFNKQNEKDNTSNIRGMFVDLKKNLSDVSKDDWNNIPEVEKFVKKKKIERYSVVPDHVLYSGLSNNQYLNSIEENNAVNNRGSGTVTMISNLNDVAQAKNSVLSLTIDNLSSTDNILPNNKVKNSKLFDSAGYLTELEGMTSNNAFLNNNNQNYSNLQKARKTLEAVIKADINNSSGYICLSRVEELDGNITKARKVIKEAAEKITDNEDIWLEAARLYNYKEAMIFLKKGLSYLPQSSKLWIAYANREKVTSERIKIYEQALNYISYNESIWKSLISLVDNDDIAKEYMRKAVECVPSSVDLWIAYAKLENYTKAKDILNRARRKIPDNLEIWVSAIMLEETNFKAEKSKINKSEINYNEDNNFIFDLDNKTTHILTTLKAIMCKAHEKLLKHGFHPSRENYVSEAQKTEESKCFLSCRAIIEECIKRDLNQDNKNSNQILTSKERFDIWKVLIEKSIYEKSYLTARFIYQYLYLNDNNNISLWLDYLNFENSHGNCMTQERLYKIGIDKRGDLEVIWLMYAKYLYKEKKLIEDAIDILIKGYINLKTEMLLVSLTKLIAENGYINESKLILLHYATYIKTTKLNILQYFDKELINVDCILSNKKDKNNINTDILNYKYCNFINKIGCFENKEVVSNKIIMKLIQLERYENNYDKLFRICKIFVENVIKSHKNNWKDTDYFTNDKYLIKIWLIFSQMQIEQYNIKSKTLDDNIKKDIYNNFINKSIALCLKGVEIFPKEHLIYLEAFKLLNIFNNTCKARTILEKGVSSLLNDLNINDLEYKEYINYVKINPNQDKIKAIQDLYYNYVKLEVNNKNFKNANMLLNKSLSFIPKSGKLLSLSIALEPLHQRESKAADILSYMEDDQFVMLSIGKLTFSINKNIQKAIKWFENITKINPDFGDAWIYLYILYIKTENFTDNTNNKNNLYNSKEIEINCDQACPKHGDLWVKYSKTIVDNWYKKPSEILKQSVKDEDNLWDYI